MKTLRYVLIAAVLCAVAPQRGAAEKPKIVVVFDIQDSSGRFQPEALSQLTEYFATQVAQGAAFRVVPRTQLKQRLKAQKTTSYKRCYDEKCQIEVGRELSAQKLISTRIIRVGTKCAVTSTLFDLRTSASERAASQKTICDQDSLVVALELVAAQLTGNGSGAAKSTPQEITPPPAKPAPSPGITPRPGITPAPRPVYRPRPAPAHRPRPAPRYRPRPAPRRVVPQQDLNRSGFHFTLNVGGSLPDDEEMDSGFVVSGQLGWEFRLGSMASLAAGLHLGYHSWAATNSDATASLIDIAPAGRFSLYLNKLILSLMFHVGYGEMEIVIPGYGSGSTDGTSVAGGVELQWAVSRFMAVGLGIEYLTAQPSDESLGSLDVLSVYLATHVKF